MVRLLRVLIRLLFQVAAVAALVWVGRELMRRWVNGPEQPQVAGTWESWQPDPAPSAAPVTTAPEQRADAPPPKSTPASKAAAPRKSAARVKPATPAEAPGAVVVGAEDQPSAPPAPVEPAPVEPAPVESAPVKRRQRPLKATRIVKPDPAPKPAAAAGPVGKAPAEKPPVGKKAAPVGKKAAPAKTKRNAGAPAWVSPDGDGEPPAGHPVKAKLVSMLYRVPGMPMYNRTVADRCYATPEAAEADGFTRAAR